MSDYRGRFAPTPSGPLHFGSLFAAVISFLEARANNGTWLVRIDDLDPPREQPGAAQHILKTLENHGLLWDEQVSYQSANSECYQERLNELIAQNRVFWCQCSRKSLASHAVYPGNCRQQSTPIEESAIRLKVTESDDTFDDKYQGLQTAHLGRDFGDVILKRRDHLFAYQLAVVTDDIQQNISHVIRGIDLMSSTFWQRDLYRAFNAPCPSYGHFPVLHTQNSDQKLSKQNLAPAVNEQEAIANLQAVFNLLHLSVATDTPQRMLQEALSLWQPHKLYNKQRLHISEIGLD